MTAVPRAVPSSVPSAVAPSASGNNVQVLTGPQLGPYKAPTGSSIIPVVPRTETEGPEHRPQPRFTSPPGTGSQLNPDGHGAPSVPLDGFLYKQGPIDDHYRDETEVVNPYKRVNSPPTRGMYTIVKRYLNHIAYNRVTDNTGRLLSGPQQRTSVMRVTLPPAADGYSPETAVPRQLPQHTNIAKFMPATGTQPYGTGVLNSDVLGAGQTAGGIGGNLYTPQPGPPPVTSTAAQPGDNPSGMPTWG